MSAVCFRDAAPADVATLAAIAAETQSGAWSLQHIADSLSTGHRIIVLSDAQQTIIGFAVFLVISAASEAELLEIVIHPRHQNRGYGFVLLSEVLRQLRTESVQRFFLEVRESNAPAYALYQKLGFTEVGRRRGYYPARASGETREDARVMECLC